MKSYGMLKQVADMELLGVKVLIDPHEPTRYYEENCQDKGNV
jgi:hypothetical protein